MWDGWTGGFDFVIFRDLTELGGNSDALMLEGEFSLGTLTGAPPHGFGFTPIARETNAWHQVACVYSNQIQQFFIDGTPSLVMSNTAFGNIGVSSIPLRIGRRQDPNNNWFAGSIDDVRVYNRALSSDEVRQLYESEAGPQVSLLKAVVPTFTYLFVGTNYQLQVSSDMSSWTNQGPVFTANKHEHDFPAIFCCPRLG
jgi:hypothetical protein